MTILDAALIVGLAARLTRFAVFDTAGNVLRVPVTRLADKLASRRGGYWADELFSCPFCVGFWLSGLVVLSWHFFGQTVVWQLAALTATLSYVVGHLAATLDGRELDRY